MTKKQTRLAILAALVLFAAGCLWLSLRPYSIEDDNSNLAEVLSRRQEVVSLPTPLTLLDTLTIGSVRYASYACGPELELGRAILDQGLNGKWKLRSCGYGGGSFSEEIAVIDGAPHWIFLGWNTAQRIASVEIDLQHRIYRLELPAADHFLVSTPVELWEEETHVLPEDIHFFDAEGTEITASVLRS